MPDIDTSAFEYSGDSGITNGKWYAGSEITMLHVKASTGGNINMSFSDTTAPGVATTTVRNSGIDSFTYGPRIWLGREVGELWGVQGRFWNLDTTKRAPSQPAPGVPNTGTNFATMTDIDRLQLYTIDLEAVRHFQPGEWKVDGTFGARHASFDSFASSTTFGVFTTGNFINLGLSNGSTFDGTGLTSGFTARRAIGQSSASLFFSGRGSCLWGQTDSFARVVGTVASSPSAPLVGAATVTRNNAQSSLSIAEVQAGVQWDVELRYLPATAFFRTAFEGQYWHIDGPPTGGAGFGGTIGEITTNSFASAGLGEARLLGLVIGAGLNW